MRNREKMKGSLYSQRVKAGGHWLVFFEVLIYWCAETALTVATGYFLWGTEYTDDTKCSACNN
jgi:hypothetical protein